MTSVEPEALGQPVSPLPLLPLSDHSRQPMSPGSGHFVHLVADLLRRGHRVRFRAPGQSMHPTIRDGEMVTVRLVPPEDVRLGDVLLCRLERGLTAHRVVAVEKRGGNAVVFRLRGDASASCDESVEPNQVLGKVVSVERRGRLIGLCTPGAKFLHAMRLRASRVKRWIRRRKGWAGGLLAGSEVQDSAPPGSDADGHDQPTKNVIR